MQPDLSKKRLDIEQNTPRSIWESQNNSKKDACMKFYDVARPLYLEANLSGIDLGASLLQVREGLNCRHDKVPDNVIFWSTAFASMSLSSVQRNYSKTEWNALGIVHRLENFHHYCFVREVSIITDHKPLVAILSKNVSAVLIYCAVNKPVQGAQHTYT